MKTVSTRMTNSLFKTYKPKEKLLLAVDCIIFGFDGTHLKALLIKRAFEPQINKWSLMGGFVDADESVDAAAKRVLSTLTGLTDVFMEQLHCFGDVQRDSGGRVVSIAYYALIKINDYNQALLTRHHAKWFDVNKLPKVVFDHAQMIDKAQLHLREIAAIKPIGFTLLPEKFTLQELQYLYEAIYHTPLDKRNFIKKILSLQILKKLNEKDKATSKKGSFYFIFDKKKYQRLQTSDLKFI